MKIATYGDGFIFGDPNLRWGNPSYLLEPGDPGYVPPTPSPNQPPTKGKKVKRNSYYPMQVAKQILWLENWRLKLAGHATALGLSAGQVSAGVADARWLIYILQSWLNSVRAWSQSCKEAAKAAQNGAGVVPMLLPTFTAPALPDGVTPVAAGALNRIFALVQVIKDSAGYLPEIGEDLGLIGSEHVGPEMATLRPPLQAINTPDGVNLPWTWDGHSAFLDMIEIEVDRDGLGWKPLVTDTTPGYLDTFPQPPALTTWKYRAIYRVGDHHVGQWSEEVSVVVGGKR